MISNSMWARTLAALALVAAGRTEAGARLEAFLNVPATTSSGQRFEAEISIVDGSRDLLSYGFRLEYDPSALRIVEIKGGRAEGFTATPLTNPAGFTSGVVDLTANNDGFQPTPADAYCIAAITFEVVAGSGRTASVTLSASPRAQAAVSRPFGRPKRVRFPRTPSLISIE